MGCFGDLARRLWRGGSLRREASILSQNGGRKGGAWTRMVSLEAQHVLAGTHGGCLTCRGRRTKVRPKKLRFQQPRIGLVSPFFNRRRFLDQPERVQPGRWSARYEPVAAGWWFGRRRQVRSGTEWTRECVEAQWSSGHPCWQVQPGRLPCLRWLHFLGFLSGESCCGVWERGEKGIDMEARSWGRRRKGLSLRPKERLLVVFLVKVEILWGGSLITVIFLVRFIGKRKRIGKALNIHIFYFLFHDIPTVIYPFKFYQRRS